MFDDSSNRTLGAVLLSFVLVIGVVLFAAPSNEPTKTIIDIPAGTALPSVAGLLAEYGIIRDARAFSLLVRLAGGAGDLHAGIYRFAAPENAFSVVARMLRGVFGIAPIRITFIEGTDVRQMSALVAQNFPNISANDFYAAAEAYQGYLFPDTYDFLPSDSIPDILTTMQQNFSTRIASIAPEVRASPHSLSDIIVMASLVEREAQTPADRRIVAGILWNRITIGMALQVDADPATYTSAGLPPIPIDNPSLDSIEAAADPTPTQYLYYLTGTDGQMHYATTFAEHEANLKKYLN